MAFVLGSRQHVLFLPWTWWTRVAKWKIMLWSLLKLMVILEEETYIEEKVKKHSLFYMNVIYFRFDRVELRHYKKSLVHYTLLKCSSWVFVENVGRWPFDFSIICLYVFFFEHIICLLVHGLWSVTIKHLNRHFYNFNFYVTVLYSRF